MRPAIAMIIAAGLAASPVAAQQTEPANADDSVNATAVVEPDLATGNVAVNDIIADPLALPAPAEAAPVEVAADTQRPARKQGFPWGILGLLGLAGLLARRRT